MRHFLFTIISTITLLSSFDTPYNSNYVEEYYDKFDLIYPEEYSFYKESIAKKVDSTIKHYEKSFGFELINRLKVILASSKDQVSNGYATPMYTNKIVFFNGGSSEIDYFSSPFWIDSLIHHELAHTFQMNAQKSEFSKVANSIFGSSPNIPIIQIFPNTLLPTALIEGNAVLNESLFGVGGRLHSGISKALFLSTFKNLDKERFVNNHLEFPFLEEKYIIGGFFNLYLYKLFGIDKVNGFFLEHSSKFLPSNPLLINHTFKEYFGFNFNLLFSNFLKNWKSSAEKFKFQDGEKIAFSEIYFPITNNLDYLLITSSKRDEQAETKIFSRFRQKFIDEKYLSDGGRVFYKDKEFIEAKNDNSNVQEYSYGLWKDENLLPKSRGKIYFDFFEDNWLYFDLNKSFETAHLYLEKGDGKSEFIDEVASVPVFDDSGNIYYFKQKGENRSLFKNGLKIFTFKGFFSRIVDIINNKIYFIANSKLGSTLYLFNDGNIFRVFNSDNIYDGKLIDSKNIVLTTIKSDGYHYLKVKLPKIRNMSIENIFYDNLNSEFKDSNISLNPVKSKDYSSFKDLSFIELYLEFGSNFINYAKVSLQDSIGYNNLNFSFQNSDDKTLKVTYSNRENWINYGVSGQFSEYSNNKLSANMTFQLNRFENRGSDFTVQTFIEDDNFEFIAGYGIGEFEQYGNSIYYNYLEYYQPFYKFSNEKNSIGFSSGYGSEIFKQLFANVNYKGILNLEREKVISIETDLDIDDLSDISMEGIVSRVNSFKSVNKFSGTLSKVLEYPMYSFKFPLSLRRESIYFKYNHLLVESDDFEYINEMIFGITLEVLTMHKFPIPITFKYINNSFDGNSFKFTTTFEF